MDSNAFHRLKEIERAARLRFCNEQVEMREAAQRG